MTTQTEKSSSFLESFGRFLGQLPMGVQAPILEHRAEIEFQQKKRLYEQEQANRLAAAERAGELIRQRDVFEHYQQKPLQEKMHGVRPEWGETDALKLLLAYGEAGIDPEKRAKAEQAELATEAFQRGIQNITNQAALVNIGMGKEYKPVELKGGVFYNPYDTENFNFGSTDKHQAETRLKKTEADEQELRLKRIRGLGNDLMQLNAMNSKELGKPIEAVVEKDGKSVKTLISQDSSGNYHHRVVTDDAGLPLEIPPEAVDGGGLTTDQKNVKYYSQLWGKTEAETAEILKSKSLFSDAGFIEDRLMKNAQGAYGNRNSDKKILTATFDDFVRARYGSYFPSHFIDEVKRSRTMKDADKDALIADIEAYNQQMFKRELAGQAAPDSTASTPATAPPPVAMPVQQPVPAAPTPAPMPAMQPAPAMPTPAPVPIPQPVAQLPTPLASKPAPMPDFQQFAETVMTNNSPTEINAALKNQGFDLSPQAMGVMAIDAINQGVSPRDIQQLYQLLGIKWTPPA